MNEQSDIDKINQKLAESELTNYQIDKIRHQDELDLAKKAELAKGFDPQLELLIENVLKATDLSSETKTAFAKARKVKSRFPDRTENEVGYNPSILDELPFPHTDDVNIPLGDLARILEAIGDKAEILMDYRINNGGTFEPLPDGQKSHDTKYMMVRTPDLPDMLIRVGAVNGLYQGRSILGKDTKTLTQYDLAKNLSTGYSPSKAPHAKIFLFEAVPAKVPMKQPVPIK